jgi:hypothetical protein
MRKILDRRLTGLKRLLRRHTHTQIDTPSRRSRIARRAHLCTDIREIRRALRVDCRTGGQHQRDRMTNWAQPQPHWLGRQVNRFYLIECTSAHSRLPRVTGDSNNIDDGRVDTSNSIPDAEKRPRRHKRNWRTQDEFDAHISSTE